jgi:raffinose/stachyose/melibiose transport system substrate-binding protein
LDSQELFIRGSAAIYPAGSWEIPLFKARAKFPLGAFKAPLATGTNDCYITELSDFGIGINAASPNVVDARKFLEWMSGREFGELYANAFPGAYPLSPDSINIQDPLAATFLSWRAACKSTIPNSYQIVSGGKPNLENQLWEISARVMDYTLSPQAAALQAQRLLEYTRAKK